jgi:microcystin-dependent protein
VLAATSTAGTQILPTANLLAKSDLAAYHAADGNLTPMNATSVAATGGSQAHLNMQPFLPLNFSIALQGIFPSAN